VADFVREEVLYREALARGLDRDDLVVRRRLVQKMEILAVGNEPPVGPSDLMDFYLEHRGDTTVPESVSFRHVFFSVAARGAAARGAATRPSAACRSREIVPATSPLTSATRTTDTSISPSRGRPASRTKPVDRGQVRRCGIPDAHERSFSSAGLHHAGGQHGTAVLFACLRARSPRSRNRLPTSLRCRTTRVQVRGWQQRASATSRATHASRRNWVM
jgi:hypothetical protein